MKLIKIIFVFIGLKLMEIVGLVVTLLLVGVLMYLCQIYPIIGFILGGLVVLFIVIALGKEWFVSNWEWAKRIVNKGIKK